MKATSYEKKTGTRDALSIVVNLPRWVPVAARNYLIHTETGLSIRGLARAGDCHASTILRQIRRYENRRDDPLVDDVLRRLSRHVPARLSLEAGDLQTMNFDIRTRTTDGDDELTEARIEAEGARVLRRLCEGNAVLAVARDMEMAVVVRDRPDGGTLRTAVINIEMAQALALREWISCSDHSARVAKYNITALGRSELKRLLAKAENRALGFGEAPASFQGAPVDAMDGDDDFRRFRNALAESPLVGLARRKDRDGTPFLSKEMVMAGERLREDFEIAQMEPNVTQKWESFLTGPGSANPGSSTPGGAAAARERVAAALADLGPGLGDVVLRCCCYLEGLEQTEKRLGWAARSGKIVLRIALLRLQRHYTATQGKYGPMIG